MLSFTFLSCLVKGNIEGCEHKRIQYRSTPFICGTGTHGFNLPEEEDEEEKEEEDDDDGFQTCGEGLDGHNRMCSSVASRDHIGPDSLHGERGHEWMNMNMNGKDKDLRAYPTRSSPKF